MNFRETKYSFLSLKKQISQDFDQNVVKYYLLF